MSAESYSWPQVRRVASRRHATAYRDTAPGYSTGGHNARALFDFGSGVCPADGRGLRYGYGTGTGPSDPAAGLVVAPTAATIQGGKTLQLNLTAHDETGKSVTPTKVTWVSSNPRVADVNGNGLVTGHSIGASEITVYWAGLSKHSRITVTEGSGSGSGSCSTAARLTHPSRVRTSIPHSGAQEGVQIAMNPQRPRQMPGAAFGPSTFYFLTTNTFVSAESPPRNTMTLYVPGLSPLGWES